MRSARISKAFLHSKQKYLEFNDKPHSLLELYKKFSETLCPYLHKVYTQAHTDGVLPPTLTEVLISVIHKNGRNPEEVASFSPISLLYQNGIG